MGDPPVALTVPPDEKDLFVIALIAVVETVGTVTPGAKADVPIILVHALPL